MVQLFDNKYEIRKDANNFILITRTKSKSRKGEVKIKEKFTYYSTLDKLAYGLLRIESKNMFTEKSRQELSTIINKITTLEKKLMKEMERINKDNIEKVKSNG